MRRVRLELWALAALGFAACGGAEEEQPPSDEVASAARNEDLATLGALGYTDFAPDSSGAEEGSRVVLHVPSLRRPGYDLYTSIPHGRAELMDAEGKVLRAWSEEDDDVDWMRVRLLSNGDLLVLGKDSAARPGTARFLERRSWSDERLWRRSLPVHHDAVELEDGRILVLTDGERSVPAIHPTRMCRDESYAVLSAAGELLEERSFFDVHAEDPDRLALQPAPTQGIDPSLPLDVFHANSIRRLGTCERTGEDPLYAPDNLLVSFRHQDAVAILAPDGGFLWAWGQGELQVQHEATLLPSGRVLLLDNGDRKRGYSRVVEVDPLTDEVTWEYRSDPPKEFFTASRGTVHALANGHVLVGSSNQGEAFEATRGGELVWRFLNPYTDDQGRRGALRIERLPVERVQPLLQR